MGPSSVSSASVVCLVGLALIVGDADCVDRGNFKTCQQASFCSRLRDNREAAAAVKYHVQPDSVIVQETGLKAVLVSSSTPPSGAAVPAEEVLWTLDIGALEDNTFRFKIDEAYPRKARHRPEHVLASEPLLVPLRVSERSPHRVALDSGSNRVVLTYSPFRIDFFSGDVLVVTTNSRGLLTLEHQQNRSSDDATDASGWRETFKSHTDSRPYGPTAVGLDFAFPGAKHLYGIPEHADNFDLDDTSGKDPYRLYNLDVFEYELDERMALYAAVPFMMAHTASGRSTGIFWLNAAETWIDVKKGASSEGGGAVGGLVGSLFGSSSGSNGDGGAAGSEAFWMSESGIVDVFVMLGPGPKEVSRQFTSRLTGTTPLPPFFALGYHQCKWNYRDAQDVSEVNANFDNFDIPYDVIWLDIEHTDGKRYFTWDPVKFANPEDMINGIAGSGRKMVTIVDPHIKVDSGYHVYKEGLDEDIYVKKAGGVENFEGWCWPGNSAYADFFLPKARQFFAGKYALDQYKGSTLDLHTWNDMNEPSVFNGPEVTMPKDVVHHGGWEHRDVHNMYGHVNVMATHAGHLLRSGGKRRPFILTRSGFAGTQRFAAIWTGDNTANWDHLKVSVPMCLSLSISGMSFVGADVGGFFGNPDAELITRWYQAGAFLPFFRAHAHLDSRRREPWLFGDPWTGRIRSAILNRYKLLPLWYTLFYQNEAETGVPPMRPLFYEFPDEPEVLAEEEAYMVGDSLLVRPVFAPDQNEVNVYLPKGSSKWYSHYTGAQLRSGEVNRISATLDDPTPVVQRGGTVVPTLQRQRRSSAVMLHDPYTLVVALDGNGSARGHLYIDDGNTFEYRDGAFNYIQLVFQDKALTGTLVKPPGLESKAWLERVIVYGFENGAGGEVKATLRTPVGDLVSLETTYDPQTKVLVVRKPGVKLAEDGWSITFR